MMFILSIFFTKLQVFPHSRDFFDMLKNKEEMNAERVSIIIIDQRKHD